MDQPDETLLPEAQPTCPDANPVAVSGNPSQNDPPPTSESRLTPAQRRRKSLASLPSSKKLG